MEALARAEPQRWNLGGVPLFQAEVPGRVRAMLMFRVGMADEPLHMAGVTHLIEHLALSGLGEQPYEYNGSVDQTHTTFVVSGTAGQVVDFFARVTAALGALPLDRVAIERRIIETEAAGHVSGSLRGSMRLRFGASGYGTLDYTQVGLLWLTPQAVAQWAAAHFTSGNAAAWVAGPVIPELRFDLAPGARIPAPAPVPKQLRSPCVTQDRSHGVTASMIGARSTALATGFSVLEYRARQRIRHAEGLSYTVQTAIEQLDGRVVHALAMTDALQDHAKKAGSALLDVADVLSLSGPEPAEIQRVVSAWDEAISDPQSVVAEMDGMARDELLGVTPRTFATIRQETAALTGTAVADALKPVLKSLILIIPEGTESPRPHFAPYPLMQAHPLPGTEVPSAYDTGEKIVVGPAGISMCDAERRAYSIIWQEVAVGVRWQDGSRLLIGRDGSDVLFRPPMWRNPALIMSVIDRNTPADRFVEVEGPGPSAELPRPPKLRRGSIIAGRGPLLIAGAGLILLAIAFVLYQMLPPGR
jgi:zinc protease